MDVDFENFYFFHFLDPKFPDAAASAAASAAAAGRTLRSQPNPSPNAPRDQIRRKGPCCDNGGPLEGNDKFSVIREQQE